MYGQGGSFNPHYRHGAPPPQHQPGVTGSFPQNHAPPPPAPYPQHPGMRPPPVPYQHGVPPPQNQPYPFAQQQRGYAPMPMPPQQRGYAPMPMPAVPPPPPQQAIYQAPPQYPMPGALPPPPPRPPSFAPENVLPPSGPPPPPPPPPSSPPPPVPLAPHTAVVTQSWDAEAEGKEGGDIAHDSKTLKAATQLIVSDDSDMDMDGDEDSPSRQPLTPENSSLVTAECTGDVDVSKSVSDVSSLGKDLPTGSGENAKTALVTMDGGSLFRLIQGYDSNDSANEVGAGPGGASTHVLPEDNKHNQPDDRNTEISYQKHANPKGNVNAPSGTEHNDEAGKYRLKDESSPVKHGTDVLEHLAKEDLSDSECDGGHGRRQRKRNRSKSPHGRSCSPLGSNKGSPSQSSSPGNRSRPPYAKRVHPAGKSNDSGDRIAQQEGLVLIEKSNSSSNGLIGKVGDNAAADGALGQHFHGDNLTSETSQPVSASANASNPHKVQRPCFPSESQSDLNVSSSSDDQIPVGQSTASAPFASVQTTKNSMAHDQPHPQSLRPPEHMPSSNTIRLPGQPLYAASEFPQTQFQHNVIGPANEFMQNQMRSYPPPELSRPRPLDFHHHTLPPAVPSHQQPSAIPVENAPVPPNRWSEYSGGVGLSYPPHQPPYGQHQPPGNLDSGTNLDYPSFQRFPSTLPGSSDLGPLSDVGLPKSSIKPHYNPFASTFEQTDPILDIGPVVSPNAVGSISTKAEHMNALSPFGQSFPGSRTHANESSAEAVSNKQKPFRQEFSSAAPYDPLLDSIEPSSSSINKVDPGKDKNWSAAGSRDVSKLMNIEVDSENMHGRGVVAESEVEGLGDVAADTEAGMAENASPEFLGAKDWNSDIPGDIDDDQTMDKNKKVKDSRSMKLFKIAIADFVKEVLKPSWRQGNMSKEAFKTIVRKTVDKVSNSVPSSHIPKTPAKIKHYVQSSQRKVIKLVMGYVDKYVKL